MYTPALVSQPDAAEPRPHVLHDIERDVWLGFHQIALHATDDADLFVEEVHGASLLGHAGSDVLYLNRVLGLGVAAPANESDLDDIIAAYARTGVRRFFVQLDPSARPESLPSWLTARGFVHYNRHAKLWRRAENPPTASTDLHVARVEPEAADAFADLTAGAFDWPPFAHIALARLVSRPEWRIYGAFDGADLVAAAGLYVKGPVGYLGPAATHPDYRGRGAQSSFIAHRIREAEALGCRWLVSETAEDKPDDPAPSFRNLRRSGFRLAYHRDNYLLQLSLPLQQPHSMNPDSNSLLS